MTTTVAEKTQKEITPSEKQELSGAERTRPGRAFTPAVDIFETESAITVLADVPGVRSEGLTIDLRDNILTIDATPRTPQRSGEHTLFSEYETGSFYRQFRLSNAVDQSRIDASLSNGVLRLVLPKAEAARPRKIEVHAS